MKKTAVLPIAVLLGSGGVFALRWMQNRTGFEPVSGLAIPGNPYAIALLLFLAVLTALFLFLTRQLPAESEKAAFTAAFSTVGAGIPTLLVMGDFLLMISGGLSLYSCVMMGMLLPPESDAYGLGGAAVYAGGNLVLGLLTVLAAVCLFPAITRCRRHPNRESRDLGGNLLLAPVACLVVRMVLTSRTDSINPTLMAYYPELLALAALTLGFYQLAAFAFGGGKTRRFALWSALSVVLCAATLADLHDFASLALYAACALLQLGFLLLRLNGLSAPTAAVPTAAVPTAAAPTATIPTAAETASPQSAPPAPGDAPRPKAPPQPEGLAQPKVPAKPGEKTKPV
ncbi:MAG: hypothetical protein RRY97_02230 [Oscillibacter sp.]